MPISFTCPHCGAQMNVDDKFAGQTGPCAKCGGTINIPSGPGGASAQVASPRSVPVLVIVLVAAVGGLVVCGGILAALLLPAVQSAREAARRTQCANSLRQINMAMMQYEAQYGSLPPAYVAGPDGKPMHSWRVLLLPFLEQQGLYGQYNFDEPWDGPNNRRLASQMPRIYQCASDPSTSSQTDYAVITGLGTMFVGAQAMRTAQVSDGLSATILVAEAEGLNLNWMEPRDLELSKMTFKINDAGGNDISSFHPRGANTSFVDGSVHFLEESSMSPDQLKSLITPSGGESVVVP